MKTDTIRLRRGAKYCDADGCFHIIQEKYTYCFKCKKQYSEYLCAINSNPAHWMEKEIPDELK